MKTGLRILFTITWLGSLSSYSQELKLFPTFDEVIHFNKTVSDSMLSAYYNNTDPSNSIKSPKYLLIPEQTNAKLDQKLPKRLRKLGYTSKVLDKRQLNEIDSIFIQRPSPSVGYMLQCKPVFRDFLIFRNEEEIVAVAQLCFSCEQFNLIGSIVPSMGFGDYKEMKALEKILTSSFE